MKLIFAKVTKFSLFPALATRPQETARRKKERETLSNQKKTATRCVGKKNNNKKTHPVRWKTDFIILLLAGAFFSTHPIHTHSAIKQKFDFNCCTTTVAVTQKDDRRKLENNEKHT